MKQNKSNGLVVLDNKLIRASYKLTVNEIRLILVAISQMPKGDEPVDPKKAYYITKDDFVRLGVEPKNVAREIRSACKDLLGRTLTIKTPIGDLGTHWVHNILHFKSELFERLKREYPNSENDEEFINSLRLHNLMDSLPIIANSDDNIIARVVLHEDVIPYISQLKQQFTQLMLDDIAGFSSFYSYRIYLMMMQFQSTGYCKIHLDAFREALDLKDKYEATKDLKVRVIDTAVDEINEKSPYKLTYQMSKTGRKFTHLELKFEQKRHVKNTIKDVSRDPNTSDMFTVEGLNDNQLGRIARNKQFIADYNHLVSSTSPAGQTEQGWEFEMINRLKKDLTQFKKRPIREYLEY
uniref:replication initiation protein n=1 Tax=Psychrobacter sp. TaxID=56811 RepID=UPI0015983867|nr:replication initiation protein [Psychrobacter sp.]QJS05839.1 initiator RepB protein, Rep3 family [Psychrobacter sp.]